MSNYALPHEPWHDNLPGECVCAKAWKGRELVDPDCWWHQMVEAIEVLPNGAVFNGKFYPHTDAHVGPMSMSERMRLIVAGVLFWSAPAIVVVMVIWVVAAIR